jgi:FtsP/CotA-like multicopper oxidase with cupredoxin domain
MIGPDPVLFRTAISFRTEAPRRRPARRMRGRMALLIIAAALASRAFSLACAQEKPPTFTPPSPPTSTTVDCPDPVSQDLVMPPEIASDKGVLKGRVNLTQEDQRMPTSVNGGAKMTCAPQLVRVFRGDGLPQAPAARPPAPGLLDPMPGPTLRARVGDIVQLKFVNEVDPNLFDKNLDIDACVRVVGKGGSTIYPGVDKFPDCLHASSTANLHFHGTHTNPNSTGDNVFLQVRPLPRDNERKFTTKPEEAMEGFEQFFSQCAAQLNNPLASWPKLWGDLEKPSPWLAKQEVLLKAYQAKQEALHQAYPDQYPLQPLWDRDMNDEHHAWPVYYIGAVPYCFVLPEYTEPKWPPPPGSTSPIMGQAPGTHWYHAHKHGSTAIDVANGMTGAFIIEGKYDDDLTDSYGNYVLKDGKAWNARSQPVLVLNQLGTTPNLLTGGTGGSPSSPNSPTLAPVADFEVNGRIRPIAHMQPGEVQLWRILNTSGRSAAYFMAPPKGFHWRQLAQDGVQFATNNYLNSTDKPFFLAPANRVDLLVKAPMTPFDPKDAKVLVQVVVARSEVKPTAADPAPGVALMSIAVSGDPVTRNGQPAQMDFLGRAPDQPVFLTDITDQELEESGNVKRTFTFDSKGPGSAYQHTINDCQFEDSRPECKHADIVPVTLNRAEEWTIKNETEGTNGPGAIDHPFHIHINPFQITEEFDPNENLTDERTGELLTEKGKTEPVPRYVTGESQKSKDAKIADRQCVLTKNENTWSVAGACGRPQKTPSTPRHLIWWDVFAIPSARVIDGTVIPGYFKMRTRFVDYPGSYVFHCHILVHEDRGMMYTVEVQPLDIENHHH